MRQEFNGVYDGATVLVTGHTGFKGSWLAVWLKELGARVIGYSLEAPTDPSHFSIAGIADEIIHIHGDVCDYAKLQQTIAEHQPDIIFHLAAQAIVLTSYQDPKTTFAANAQGTVNVLEAARSCSAVQAMVMVTTDKCYENNEWIWGYREKDPLGGNDPYSASKAMAELAIASYRQSFFQDKGPAVASARAGNVIGGGDFSENRILPDCMKALMKQHPVQIRNPMSIRPWVHVLDPLSGYLWLGACLIQRGREYAQAWNFGPLEQRGVPVHCLVDKAIEYWGEGEWVSAGPAGQLAKPEMGMLRLNWDKASHYLHWQPAYDWIEGIKATVDWFKAYANGENMKKIAAMHIENYVSKALQCKLDWALQMTPISTNK